MLLTKSIAPFGDKSDSEGFQLRNDSVVKKLILIKIRALFNFLISRPQENLMYGNPDGYVFNSVKSPYFGKTFWILVKSPLKLKIF